MKRQKMSVEETWKQVITSLGKKFKTIDKQLAKAHKEYPELVESYNYMVGYIGFLVNHIRRHELRFYPGKQPQANDIPFPEPPDFPSAADLICRIHGEDSLRCKCARGDLHACGSPGGGPPGVGGDLPIGEGGGQPIEVIETCQDIRNDLAAELKKICKIHQQYGETPDYSKEDFTALRIHVQKVRDIFAKLMDRWCYEYVFLQEYEITGYIEFHP